MNAEYHQMMLEREERLEVALRNARVGNGTNDDWAVIRFECGLPAQINQLGKQNDHSEVRKQQRI